MISNKRSITALAFFGILGLSAGQAQAVPIEVPLSTLLDSGSIVVGDKLFDEWDHELVNSDGNTPDFSNIIVTGLNDQPNNPGLKFTANGELTVSGPGFIDLALFFRVSTLDGSARIKDNSLDMMVDFMGDTGTGLINITEDILSNLDDPLGEKFVEADNSGDPGDFILFDAAEFLPEAEIFVEKLILVQTEDDAGFASLDMFTQRFSQVPEPSSLALLCAAGLTGFGFRSRTRNAR